MVSFFSAAAPTGIVLGKEHGWVLLVAVANILGARACVGRTAAGRSGVRWRRWRRNRPERAAAPAPPHACQHLPTVSHPPRPLRPATARRKHPPTHLNPLVVNLWMSVRVGKARKAHNVKYPAMSGSDAFNCVMRGEWLRGGVWSRLRGGARHPRRSNHRPQRFFS